MTVSIILNVIISYLVNRILSMNQIEQISMDQGMNAMLFLSLSVSVVELNAV